MEKLLDVCEGERRVTFTLGISQVEYIVLMVQPWGISHCYSTLHCYNLLFYTTAIIWYIIQFLLNQGIFIVGFLIPIPLFALSINCPAGEAEAVTGL